MTKIPAALLAGCFFLATSASACELEVSNPWIRQAPPTASALAGYMVLSNTGTRDCVLTDVQAQGFARAMFHRTVHEGDVAHMKHQEQVIVPAGERLVFEPNGFHVMLMNPEVPLKAGDHVVVTLVLEGGVKQHIELPVREAMPAVE